MNVSTSTDLQADTSVLELNASMHVVALAADRSLNLFFPMWHSRRSWAPIVRNLSLASTVFYHVLVLPVWYLYEVEEGDCILTSSSNDVMKYFNLAICIIYLLGQLFPLFLANVSCIWKLAKYRKEQREIGLKAVCTTHARDQDNSSLLTATQNVTSGVNSQNQQQGVNSDEIFTPETETGPETDALGYDPFNVIYCAPNNYISTDIGASNGHRSNDGDGENHGSGMRREEHVILPLPNVSSDASTNHIAEQTRSPKLEKLENMADEMNILIPILLISLSYIILGTISATILMAVDVFHIAAISGKDRRFLLILGRILLIINYSINFAFYLKGRKFRAQLRHLLHSLKRFLTRVMFHQYPGNRD